jgi:hypothetical protein
MDEETETTDNSWISPELEAKINDELKEIESFAKDRRDHITRYAKRIRNDVVSETNKVKLVQSPDPEADPLSDCPAKVPLISHPHQSLNHEYTVIGSIGQYYREKAYDPTISQAFDAGFLTAILLVEQGLISVGENTIPKDVDDDHND